MKGRVRMSGSNSQDSQLQETRIQCYTDDWKRTNPDVVVYLPKKSDGPDGYADHILVETTPGADLLATWTMSTYEGSKDTRVVYARSEDKGNTWTSPKLLVGREGDKGTACMFGFPVISKKGRIYFFYNKDKKIYDVAFRVTARLGCHISDDDGRTWQDTGYEFDYARTRYDHPDPKVPCNAIIWQKPVKDSKGRPMVTFTRVSSLEIRPLLQRNLLGYPYYERQGGLLRFDNIDDAPEPAEMKLTWLSQEDGVFKFPIDPTIEPQHSRGYSTFHEPSIVVLPDGRLFVIAVSLSGYLVYTVSEDVDGIKWRKTEPLRYKDQGIPLPHLLAPAPFYQLKDGRYLVFYHAHDGTKFQGRGARDNRGRRPICLSVGEYRPSAHQPIWFSQPKQICDTHGVGIGPERLVWLAQYSSLTEQNGKRIYWYPDRKHFVLGRHITDEMLSDMNVSKS